MPGWKPSPESPGQFVETFEATPEPGPGSIVIVSDTDPGSVGVGKVWIQSDGSTQPAPIHVRNAANDGWIEVGSGTPATPPLDDVLAAGNNAGSQNITNLEELFGWKITLTGAAGFMWAQTIADTGGSFGSAGQFLGSDGADGTEWQSPPAGVSLVNLTAAASTYLDQNAATTNHSADTSMLIADRIDSPGGFAKYTVLEFNLSAIVAAGSSVVSANIHLYEEGGGNNAGVFTGPIGIRKIVRSDASLAQMTWNIYKTASNWARAGARGPADTRQMFHSVTFWSSPDNEAAPAGWCGFDITALVQEAIAAGENTLRILIGAINVTTGSQNALVFSGVPHATAGQRPYMSIATVS